MFIVSAFQQTLYNTVISFANIGCVLSSGRREARNKKKKKFSLLYKFTINSAQLQNNLHVLSAQYQKWLTEALEKTISTRHF